MDSFNNDNFFGYDGDDFLAFTGDDSVLFDPFLALDQAGSISFAEYELAAAPIFDPEPFAFGPFVNDMPVAPSPVFETPHDTVDYSDPSQDLDRESLDSGLLHDTPSTDNSVDAESRTTTSASRSPTPEELTADDAPSDDDNDTSMGPIPIPNDYQTQSGNGRYSAYAEKFGTGAAARAHLRRRRSETKHTQPDDTERAKKHRRYWVKQIYESIVDVTKVVDGANSNHYRRFVGNEPSFDADDIEATAHQIFDHVVDVHLGWQYPKIYWRDAKRGLKINRTYGSCQKRLKHLCYYLKHSKAMCDDALRGGITLALLLENPDSRFHTKMANAINNSKKAVSLKAAKAAAAAAPATTTTTTSTAAATTSDAPAAAALTSEN